VTQEKEENVPIMVDSVIRQFVGVDLFIGREQELASLWLAHHRISGGPAVMVLIAGESGVGKTCLVDNLGRQLAENDHLLIRGKFDQFDLGVPYSGFVQALDQLAVHLLSLDQDDRLAFCHRFEREMAGNGFLVTGLAPRLEEIVGPQPSLASVGEKEGRNRFEQALESFFRVIATREHPLTLFLDDLQWVGQASLGLLQRLLTRNQYLLIIGACRSGEVGEDHCLSVFLDSCNKHGDSGGVGTLPNLVTDHLSCFSRGNMVLAIILEPFDLVQVGKLASSLLYGQQLPSSLSSLLQAKTGGNPLLVKQVLASLWLEGVIFIDQEGGEWKWNQEEVDRFFAGDINKLINRQLSHYNDEELHLLGFAACLGYRFNADLMALVSNFARSRVLDFFQRLTGDGLLVHERGGNGFYHFAHDRFQGAAYLLVKDDERASQHLAIARGVQRYWGDVRDEAIFFLMVEQFNKGSSLLVDTKAKFELARFNLEAGYKARKGTDYNRAEHYFTLGLAILPDDCWESDYGLTVNLARQQGECLFLIGDLAGSEAAFRKILQQSLDILDRVAVHEYMILIHESKDDPEEGLAWGFRGLALLGEKVSSSAVALQILRELALVRWRLRGQRLQQFARLAPMENDRIKARFNLMMRMMPVSYFVDINVSVFLALRMTNLSLAYGLHPATSFALLTYAVAEGSFFGRYQFASQVADQAMFLSREDGSDSFTTRIGHLYGTFICHWTKPLPLAIRELEGAIDIAGVNGDVFYGHYALSALLLDQLMAGYSLSSIEDLARLASIEEPDLYFHNILQISSLVPVVLAMLRGQEPGQVNLPAVEGLGRVEEVFEQFKKTKIDSYYHYFIIFRMVSLYLAADYRQARSLAVEIEHEVGSKLLGQLAVPVHNFFYSLSLAGCYREACRLEKMKIRGQIWLNQRKMGRWAENSPENFQPCYLLVEAERACLRHDDGRAEELYQKAAELAEENGFNHYAGIAWERLAMLYLVGGGNEEGEQALGKAWQFFSDWGGTAKLKQMAARYQSLVPMSVSLADQKVMAEGDGQYQLLADNVRDAIWAMDLNFNFTYISPSVTQQRGYSVDEAMALGLAGTLAPSSYEKVVALIAGIMPQLQTGQFSGFGRSLELEMTHKDGSWGWYEVNMDVLKDRHNRPIGFSGVSRDIGKRRELIKRMEGSEKRLHRLAGHLQQGRERERARIAREMHDELGQALTGLRLDMMGLYRRQQRMEQGSEEVRQMIKTVEELSASVQRMCGELRPSLLDNLGLKAAMDHQLREFARRHPDCEVLQEIDETVLDPERSITVYRILQESLTNILRHAGASRVLVSFRLMDDDQVKLEVADNGRGIPVEKLDDVSSYGIGGMRERAQTWNGRLEIEGGDGTLIRLVMPMR